MQKWLHIYFEFDSESDYGSDVAFTLTLESQFQKLRANQYVFGQLQR